MKEGEWRFWSRGRVLFHKFFGLLHEFWSGEPLFADGSNKMRGQFKMEKGALVKRHIRVGAASWKAGATAPTAGVIATFPYLSFDTGKDDAAHYSLFIPYRRAANTDVIIHVDWYHTDAGETGSGDKVEWNMTYLSVKPGEDPTAAGTNITQLSAGTHAINTFVRTVFTTKILAANIENHDIIGLKLWRDGTNDTLGTPAIMLAVHF
ncbi:unnamed protein product, partial [marine sediment metagenome]